MEFDVKKATEAAVSWIREWFYENGYGCNAILGISGGKDSSVVAALLVEALGKDRVIGVLMPKGIQDDIHMARLLVDHLGIKSYTVNIKDSYEALVNELESKVGVMSKDSKINLPARLRMSTLYAVAQTNNGRVANTCNLSEDWVGYSTRYGDSAGDFSPCSFFTTKEIRSIGRYLGIPHELVEKTPIDGLSGMTDEEKLGFTYEVLDKYIRTGEIEDNKTKAKINHLHEINKFKLRFMDSFNYEETKDE
ncbi:MAG: NAD(+) synthase [Peptostreptococcaceae bacterium]|nr:NAD(+) synthase [Peptostreptococcaceae bacterium]